MEKTKEHVVKVQPRFMIPLPKDIRKALELQVGDQVDVEVKDKKLEVLPFTKGSLDALKESKGMFKLPQGADVIKTIEKSVVELAQ